MNAAANLGKRIGRQTLNSVKSNEGGFVKKAAQWIDDGTGNVASDFLYNNGVTSSVMDIMDTSAVKDMKVAREISADKIGGVRGSLSAQRDNIMDQMNAEGVDAATKAMYQRQYDALGSQISSLDKNGTVQMNASILDKAKAYYGDADEGFKRAAITLGAYGAAAVGTRYATGGTLTTNARGESDIAGIPLI